MTNLSNESKEFEASGNTSSICFLMLGFLIPSRRFQDRHKWHSGTLPRFNKLNIKYMLEHGRPCFFKKISAL